MSSDVVTREDKEGITILTLNRPDVYNVVNEDMMRGLEEKLDELDRDNGLRILVLTGAGSKAFCAGGDLDYFDKLRSREDGLQMSRRMQAVLERISAGPRVAIAAVNGMALGGGCEILTACHFRIAASSASFAFRQAANGLTTGWGGGVRLFRLLRRSEALRLLLTSERIDANEALRIGLVDRVVHGGFFDGWRRGENLLAATLEFARRIAAHSPLAIRSFLTLATSLDTGDIATAKELETEIFGECWVSEEFQNARQRFLKGGELG